MNDRSLLSSRLGWITWLTASIALMAPLVLVKAIFGVDGRFIALAYSHSIIFGFCLGPILAYYQFASIRHIWVTAGPSNGEARWSLIRSVIVMLVVSGFFAIEEYRKQTALYELLMIEENIALIERHLEMLRQLSLGDTTEICLAVTNSAISVTLTSLSTTANGAMLCNGLQHGLEGMNELRLTDWGREARTILLNELTVAAAAQPGFPLLRVVAAISNSVLFFLFMSSLYIGWIQFQWQIPLRENDTLNKAGKRFLIALVFSWLWMVTYAVNQYVLGFVYNLEESRGYITVAVLFSLGISMFVMWLLAIDADRHEFQGLVARFGPILIGYAVAANPQVGSLFLDTLSQLVGIKGNLISVGIPMGLGIWSYMYYTAGKRMLSPP